MLSLNYIGSKRTLCNEILSIIESYKDSNIISFGDLCAGTGIISYNSNFNITISNDIEYYSAVINRALLQCSYSDKLQKIIDDMNILEGVEGLVYKNYTEVSDRLFFSLENAKKIDAMRQYIDELSISFNEKFFLLASLLISSDKVANTASVYGAFLKKMKKSALKEIILKPIHTGKKRTSKIYNRDLLEIKESIDFIYIDPPYNSRQYGANYFVLNYIAKYEDIELRGKTGLFDYNKSDFCSKSKIKQYINNILSTLKYKYLFMSYNSEGLLSKQEINDIMKKYGDVFVHSINYKRFKSNKNTDNKSVVEYLFVLKCKQQ